MSTAVAYVDLYWLPLGAGGRSVQWTGRLFEAVAARAERRAPCDLYHSALEVGASDGRFVIEMTPIPDRSGSHRGCDLYHSALEVGASDGRFVIEMTPIPDRSGSHRGVVGEGAVGTRWARRIRVFRYELRCWRGGIISDVDEAIDSPLRLSEDPAHAERLIGLVPSVPRLVWGRDEVHAGEMWNSNSVISWLITRSGIEAVVESPAGGSVPGWCAGDTVARRQMAGLAGRSVGRPDQA